ncbi:MAG: cation-translocating P-type ATPase [Myxococcales bacterium]|nr:cation-translocating P-type ATPase [Myxococcales bacterium]
MTAVASPTGPAAAVAASASAPALASASASASPRCAHCGLPVPAGRLAADPAAEPARRFCCAGCEVVHDALREHGLDGYYRVARDVPAPARTTDKSYAELDDPAFHRLHVRTRPDGLAETSLFLEDVRCTACVWLVERVPALCAGVVEIRLDLGRSRADVVFDPARASLAAVARQLDRLGHPVHPYRGVDRDLLLRRDDRALLLRIGVAGAAAGNIMLLAIALYAGLFGGMGAGDTAFFRWTSMLVALPALGYAATPFFRGAVGALVARRLHLDLPIALGIVVGLVWGALNVVRGTGEIYFDSLAMLVFLLLVARWVQGKQHRRAASAAELLHALTPRVARRLGADGAVVEVPLEAVVAGDRVVVRAGDTIPIDGVIEEGRSAVDAGLLTGESRPVDVAAGDAVHAGTVNVAGPLTVRATAAGEETRIGQLVTRIEDEGRRRAPIQRFVDRLAGRFVAVVVTAAALTALGWSLLSAGGPRAGFEHAMALLIVTCPCALALATPLAVSIALGRAARRGLLVKGGDALERLATPGLVFLDKTGTVTEGRVRLTDWRGDADARELAAAVERGSAHPLARALVDAVEPRPALVAVDVREVLGAGVEGTVAGRRVAIGAPTWLAAHAEVPRGLVAATTALAEEGKTPVQVAVDGKVVAVAGFADAIRADARAAVDTLRARGWQVGILSGDDPRLVVAAGLALGLPASACQGGITPEGKLAAVHAARAAGPVIMVGDGVNDAAAMAAATCGVAVHGASEASVDAADVLVRRPGLAPLCELFAGAGATLAVIRRNLKVSLAYNLMGGALAVTGLIHPLVAALLMPASSLSVLFSSSRGGGFRGPEAP